VIKRGYQISRFRATDPNWGVRLSLNRRFVQRCGVDGSIPKTSLSQNSLGRLSTYQSLDRWSTPASEIPRAHSCHYPTRYQIDGYRASGIRSSADSFLGDLDSTFLLYLPINLQSLRWLSHGVPGSNFCIDSISKMIDHDGQIQFRIPVTLDLRRPWNDEWGLKPTGQRWNLTLTIRRNSSSGNI
jgi:hypothetical protein